MEKVRHQYYENAAQTLSKKLKRRNFQPIICQNKDEARDKALSMIHAKEIVSFGGSMTLNEIGIIEALYQRKQPLIDRERAENLEERHQLMKQALVSDCYLTSINGITDNGELVNIDNVGNRVAAITYGPDKVFAFVGMNKVYGDLDTTMNMVRNKTAPLNAHRLGLNVTPCAKKGTCGDCLNDECICNTIVITRRSWCQNRFTVFLILDTIGF